MGAKITVWDAAHPTRDLFYRVFDVQNISKSAKKFRLFSTHNYNILENKIGETAVIDRDVLIHYKQNRYFLHGSRPHYDQFAVGTANWNGLEGTWKDMEGDGTLSSNLVSQGSVDSTIGWTLPRLWPDESTHVHYWIAIGRSYNNVRNTHLWVLDESTTSIYHNVFNFWHSWLEGQSITT
jgi:GH15 family glucan-1,4-alpha-glucosidase